MTPETANETHSHLFRSLWCFVSSKAGRILLGQVLESGNRVQEVFILIHNTQPFDKVQSKEIVFHSSQPFQGKVGFEMLKNDNEDQKEASRQSASK